MVSLVIGLKSQHPRDANKPCYACLKRVHNRFAKPSMPPSSTTNPSIWIFWQRIRLRPGCVSSGYAGLGVSYKGSGPSKNGATNFKPFWLPAQAPHFSFENARLIGSLRPTLIFSERVLVRKEFQFWGHPHLISQLQQSTILVRKSTFTFPCCNKIKACAYAGFS